MDALGHLNNVAYFRYMEEVRVRWLSTLGEDIVAGTSGPVVFHASCTYLKPVIYPATLQVELLSEQPRRASVNLLYRFLRDGVELVAQAESKLVWVDYQRMKSISLPERLKQLIV